MIFNMCGGGGDIRKSEGTCTANNQTVTTVDVGFKPLAVWIQNQAWTITDGNKPYGDGMLIQYGDSVIKTIDSSAGRHPYKDDTFTLTESGFSFKEYYTTGDITYKWCAIGI